jgi:ECF transporter S component (folate family)
MIRFLPQVLIGAVCGPVMGLFSGLAADWLGTVIMPTGNPIFGLYVTAAIRGLMYGLFLYKNPIAVAMKTSAAQVVLRFTLCQLAVNALCHVGLNSLWFTLERTEGIFWPAYMTNVAARATTNLIQWPFQVLLMILLCKALWPSIREYGMGIRSNAEIFGDIQRE